MIGRLKGTLIEKAPPYLMVDVQGVGYEVQAPMSTFYALTEINTEICVYTHMAISETSHQLYGFHSRSDRSLFRQLIKINGVGPKMALGIMSGMEPSDFVRAITQGNLSALIKLPGVGRKTAERLLIELRDRLQEWQSAGDENSGLDPQTAGIQVTSVNVAQSEAESALIALGYKPVEASKAIRAVLDRHDVQRSEELIRLALRSMMP